MLEGQISRNLLVAGRVGRRLTLNALVIGIQNTTTCTCQYNVAVDPYENVLDVVCYHSDHTSYGLAHMINTDKGNQLSLHDAHDYISNVQKT